MSMPAVKSFDIPLMEGKESSFMLHSFVLLLLNILLSKFFRENIKINERHSGLSENWKQSIYYKTKRENYLIRTTLEKVTRASPRDWLVTSSES